MTYSIGQRFHYNGIYQEDYILAQVGALKAALIGLKSGNRYCEGITVKICDNITEQEFEEVAGGEPEKFELII